MPRLGTTYTGYDPSQDPSIFNLPTEQRVDPRIMALLSPPAPATPAAPGKTLTQLLSANGGAILITGGALFALALLLGGRR
ncbi:MAG: hypothetical protein LAQ30_01635 [Acidobacteriia bacterium]|nr:hypothetical protein [Terriglobia bacterium]